MSVSDLELVHILTWLHTVEYLPKELEKAYTLQAQMTKQFANKIALAGAHNSCAWASMDIHTTAPTPSNWKEKVGAYNSNIYVLHCAESMYRSLVHVSQCTGAD